MYELAVEKKKITIGMISMAKSQITKSLREAAALGRETLGGNGIIIDNFMIKYQMDAEALTTYEGTNDINNLICGRELTGINALKSGK